MKPGRVCSKCWRDFPCPVHGRPQRGYQPWGKNHDAKQHMALRRRVVPERGARCQRCGYQGPPDGRGLHMHHLRPGYDRTDVILLCHDCHKAIDPKAR